LIPLGRFVPIAVLLLCQGSAAGQTVPASIDTLAERVVAASAPERSALLARDGVASLDLAKALNVLGDRLRLDAEFAKALVAFQSAEIVARQARADAEIGRALNGAADSLFRITDLDRAKTVAEDSVRFHEQRSDPNGQAEAWNTIANVLFYKADYAESLAAATKTRDLWTASGNRRGVGRVLNNLGNIHKTRGDFDQAMAHYEQALTIFEELGDRRSAGVVSSGISIVHFGRGDYPLALHYAQRSLALSEAGEDRVGISKSLDTIGNIYRAQGAHARALEAFQRSLALRRTLGDKYAIAESENNIGLVHLSQGDYQLAIDAYKRGLRVATQAGTNEGLEAEALANIGTAAWRLGQRSRARANFRASLALADRQQSNLLRAANLNALGHMALEDRRTGEAENAFLRALGVGEQTKDQAGIAEAQNGLAKLNLAAGRYAEAADIAARSIGLAERYEQWELLWEAHTLRGSAYRRLGDLGAARRELTEAIAVVERLRTAIVARPLGGDRFMETKLSPYHELVSLALAERTPAEALEVADRAKARVLSDLLQGHAGVPIGIPTAEAAEERRLRASLRSANERVLAARTAAMPDEARIAAIEGERQTARSRYEAFQSGLYASHPELRARRGDAAPFAMNDAATILQDAQTAVLHYVVTHDSTHLFVLASQNGRITPRHFPIAMTRDALTTRVRRLRQSLATRDLLFAQDVRDLYAVLLAPARPVLEGKTKVVIIPDGPLWETPFQALQDPSGRYLIESVAVSYAPSLAVLRDAIRATPQRSGPATVLAMGTANVGSPATLARSASSLGPLPEAERQVEQLRDLYGERSTTYLGPLATESRFKAEAPKHRIIHLASHGLFEEGSPLYSSVVLSRGAEASPDDGLLEAWELLELTLDADVVILSACETGRGRIASGEGLVGTTWALLASGARATIVSQWKVEASSATQLMGALHRRLARGDRGKAEQLRLATLEVLRNPRYAHPFYWAPFVLVGDSN
jgi:CHAT domain-containing protein/Tfp pilus assembly protein PilF